MKHLVPPGASLQQALRQAADGDTIELGAGEHRGEVGVITQRRLTLRGAGGLAVLHAAGRSAEGKAILVVRDGDVQVENLAFRGARVPDRNGAGIRFERGRLLVRGCSFVDNENGILTANFEDAELDVQDSDFAQAPPGTPLPHLVYVGRIARFSLTGCRVGGGQDGHLVKSRAAESYIVDNQLVDGPGGRASYELEFPNGGLACVVGNTIAQGRGTTNPVLVSYGAESYLPGRTNRLVMLHNTLVNDAAVAAVFLQVRETRPPVAQLLHGNRCTGPGTALPSTLKD